MFIVNKLMENYKTLKTFMITTVLKLPLQRIQQTITIILANTFLCFFIYKSYLNYHWFLRSSIVYSIHYKKVQMWRTSKFLVNYLFVGKSKFKIISDKLLIHYCIISSHSLVEFVFTWSERNKISECFPSHWWYNYWQL